MAYSNNWTEAACAANYIMPLKANNQVICILTYFQAEYTRDMEDHAHGAGDSTQPAAPRVGTLHAIPPNIVRLLDLQNSITDSLTSPQRSPWDRGKLLL